MSDLRGSPSDDCDRHVDPQSARCPLCESTLSSHVESVTWGAIRSALCRYVGAPPPDTLDLPGIEEVVKIVRCATCALEYSQPTFAGKSAFYEYVTAVADYYDPARWDFRRARSRIRPTDSVIDLGCGAGDFLCGLPNSLTVGIDANPTAIRIAKERGIDVIEGAPWDVPDRLDASFDVVCSFQTMEHLASVDQLVSSARRLAVPGGLILISVPNRERSAVNEVAVLDWPPHHLSRWAPEQMQVLSERWSLESLAVEVETRTPGRSAILGSYVLLQTAVGRSPIDIIEGQERQRLSWRGLRTRHTLLGVFRRPLDDDRLNSP